MTNQPSPTARGENAAFADAPWGDEEGPVRAVLDWVTCRLDARALMTANVPSSMSLQAEVGETITEAGIGHARALDLFDRVLLPATRTTGHPMNFAHIPTAPSRSALAFEAATGVANVFAGMWEAGAGAIHAENQVIDWLRQLLCWPDTTAGCFVSGGTVGNLSALVAARTAMRSRRVAQGLAADPDQGWAIIASTEAHSSIGTACAVMDVDLVQLPAGQDDRISAGQVAAALAGSLGERVLAVVAVAGTTLAGAVDELSGIAEICRRAGTWLHVDGAYGGAGLLAPATRPLFAGIEHADSFIVDPHKWLFAPYDCCAVLYRRPHEAEVAHTQECSVLTRPTPQANPCDLAIHLTRRPRGLPLWFSLATHGAAAYRTAVERSLDITRTVAAWIEAHPDLRLVQRPQLSVLLFERVGWSETEHQAWSRQQADAGRLLCIPVTWHDRLVLRMAFVNPHTQPDSVIEALQSLAASPTGTHLPTVTL